MNLKITSPVGSDRLHPRIQYLLRWSMLMNNFVCIYHYFLNLTIIQRKT